MKSAIIERTDCITKYFKDISKTKLLTVEEEVDLTNRINGGDESAVDELIKANLKFVISIAKDYQNLGLPLSDLISDGNIGLIKAATRFDPTRGFRFISYAVYWIRQSIMLSLNENSRMIRLPSNIITQLTKKNQDLSELTEDDLAQLPTCISLNTQLGENQGYEIIDTIDNSENEHEIDLLPYETNKLAEAINKSLKNLTKRERNIIECYFGINTGCEPMTLEAIGDRYNLTKERIRQIKEKAIRRLRYDTDELQSLLNQ